MNSGYLLIGCAAAWLVCGCESKGASDKAEGQQASGVVTAQVEDDHVAVVTEGVVLTPERGGACEGDVAMSDGALTAVPLPGLVPR